MDVTVHQVCVLITDSFSLYLRFSFQTVSSSSQILRYVNVRIVPNADCALIYGAHVVVKSTICALGLEFAEQGTCSGDSGSPLFIQEGKEKTQIAVTSFVSSKGCGKYQLLVLLFIYLYHEFIK